MDTPRERALLLKSDPGTYWAGLPRTNVPKGFSFLPLIPMKALHVEPGYGYNNRLKGHRTKSGKFLDPWPGDYAILPRQSGT